MSPKWWGHSCLPYISRPGKKKKKKSVNVVGWLERESEQRLALVPGSVPGLVQRLWEPRGLVLSCPWSLDCRGLGLTVGSWVTSCWASVALENSALDRVAFLQHLTSKFTDAFHLHRFNCTHHGLTMLLWSRVKMPIVMSHHFYSPGFCSCGLVTESHPALCDSMDFSSPGSSVHGISQARRILEWVPISFSRGSSQIRDRACISCVSCISRRVLFEPPGKPVSCSTVSLSCVWLFVTPWTVVHGSARILCPSNSSGRNTGVGSHALL